jgi:hypothetical protein
MFPLRNYSKSSVEMRTLLNHDMFKPRIDLHVYVQGTYNIYFYKNPFETLLSKQSPLSSSVISKVSYPFFFNSY